MRRTWIPCLSIWVFVLVLISGVAHSDEEMFDFFHSPGQEEITAEKCHHAVPPTGPFDSPVEEEWDVDFAHAGWITQWDCQQFFVGDIFTGPFRGCAAKSLRTGSHTKGVCGPEPDQYCVMGTERWNVEAALLDESQSTEGEIVAMGTFVEKNEGPPPKGTCVGKIRNVCVYDSSNLSTAIQNYEGCDDGTYTGP